MKFRVYEDLETVLKADYFDNTYSDADIENIRDIAYNSYSDDELWELFKSEAWPRFSAEEKKAFLDDFEGEYSSILEVPVEDGMSDKSWIIDVLDEYHLLDDDYEYYADKYFDSEEYSDNLKDYKEYDDMKKGIGLGV